MKLTKILLVKHSWDTWQNASQSNVGIVGQYQDFLGCGGEGQVDRKTICWQKCKVCGDFCLGISILFKHPWDTWQNANSIFWAFETPHKRSLTAFQMLRKLFWNALQTLRNLLTNAWKAFQTLFKAFANAGQTVCKACQTLLKPCANASQTLFKRFANPLQSLLLRAGGTSPQGIKRA